MLMNHVLLKVDHLTKKPQNGERCLREIQSILVENDISPFEVGFNCSGDADPESQFRNISD